jgi:hypothetical protein
VSRFARPASEAGFIEPRSTSAEDERPRGRAAFARLLGAAGMIALTAILYWLLTDPSFRVAAHDVHLEGLQYTDEASVRARLGALERSPNVFRVRASDIVAELASLRDIASAEAIVTLPASVSVRVEERQPIFAWSNGTTEWLVDRDGRLFAPADVLSATGVDQGVDQGVDPDGPAAGPGLATGASQLPDGSPDAEASGEPPGGPGLADGPASEDAARTERNVLEASLPRVEDYRTLRAPVSDDGSHLSAIDLAVMRQLLALTPEDLGSQESSLVLHVDEHRGYILDSDRWQAIFGHYTPLLQGPEAVPRQVQCLRWLLADRQKHLDEVHLAVSADACGTFTENATAPPKPARTPRP